MGPLHSDRQYDIGASKEGFVLSPLEGKQGDFKAFALAGVTFKVAVKRTLTIPTSVVVRSLLLPCDASQTLLQSRFVIVHGSKLIFELFVCFLTKQLCPLLPSLS